MSGASAQAFRLRNSCRLSPAFNQEKKSSWETIQDFRTAKKFNRASSKNGRPSSTAKDLLMSRFAIRTPYLIIVSCLIILVLGVSSIARMPVDMFPSMNVPVVIVATFYSGMPPEQVEGNITYHLERFFHPRQRHRPHRVAIAQWRQHYSRLFSARYERGYRCRYNCQSGCLRHEGSSSGYFSSGRAQVRCIKPAGLSRHHEWRRDE